MEVEKNNEDNIIFEPTYLKLDSDGIADQNNIPNNKTINASSMVTYSKIICCICGVSMDANSEGICEACAKKNIDITTGITKVASLTYCRTCDRFKKPPWMKVERESQDMMNLCLSKIKGLNKVQVIDSSFVWTEPHSKEIKIKITIQKELNKSLISTSFIITFKEDWTQCEDCKKAFTPHQWRAVVQLRQKVNHKRTFLFLEQVILKHKAQSKALNIKEHPEGVDFYFSNKAQANSFCSFVHEFLICQSKTSRQLISVDEKSNEAEYKESFRLEIAPVCQDDLVILNEEQYKKLGSIGPVLLCYKQVNSLKFIDPISFETLDLDNNTYWRYELKSYIDRKCLSEFLILSVEEEVDYKKIAEKDKSMRIIKKIVSKKNKKEKMDIDTNNDNDNSVNINLNETKNSIKSNMTNSSKYMERLEKKLEEKKIKIVNVKCIRNSEKEENKEIIETRSFLGRKMHPGDIYYGYDLTRINISDENEEFLSKKKGKIPDIILVKKKYNNYKRIFKLKHLKMDLDDENEESEEEKEDNNKKKSKKNQKKKAKHNKNNKNKNLDKDRDEFLEDVGTNKGIREYINMYKDPKALEELNKQMDNLGIDQKDLNDSDLDIKYEELLDDVNDDLDKLNLDNKDNNKLKEIKSDEKDADKIGKRERDGKPIKDE